LQQKLDEAVDAQRQANDVQIHRLALGVTAFPFTDPAPERVGEQAMLGVRFDLGPISFVGQGGSAGAGDMRAQENEHEESADENDNTYFVMLRRLQDQGQTYLKVHHHTIPGHIDVEGYAERYLPLPDALLDNEDDNEPTGERANNEDSALFEDDSGIDVTQDIHVEGDDATASNTNASSSTTNVASANVSVSPTQSLHPFIHSLLDALRSWHARTKSIAHLRHQLNLQPTPSQSTNTGASPRSSLAPDLDLNLPLTNAAPKHNIASLTQTTHDARQLKIIWTDSTLGILRIAYDGTVDRAVVYGARGPTQDPSEPSESELSELASDDDRNVVRVRALTHAHALTHTNAMERGRDAASVGTISVRMHDVERLLMVDEEGKRLMIHDLVDRLRVVDERVFSA